MNERWIRYTARGLSLAWAGFWVWFGLASGLGEGLTPVGVLRHMTLPGLIFLVSALVAWRWEHVGGALLLLEGLLTLVGYPLQFSRFPAGTILMVLATMALPPLIAGVLFVWDWRRLRFTGQ
jgi:hypothetical protein